MGSEKNEDKECGDRWVTLLFFAPTIIFVVGFYIYCCYEKPLVLIFIPMMFMFGTFIAGLQRLDGGSHKTFSNHID